MIEVILGCIVVIVAIALVMTIYSNKFEFAIIKINEAESNLDVLLSRKHDLLERTIPIIKKELKIDDFLDILTDLDETSVNHFQLNGILKTASSELYKKLDEYDKLFKSEALNQILRDLNDNEDSIIGSIKFYNDNVVIFNQLISSFPAKIIALFKHYKTKDFYNDEDKEMYEILNS